MTTPIQVVCPLACRSNSSLAANDPLADILQTDDKLAIVSVSRLAVVSLLLLGACSTGAPPSISHATDPVPVEVFIGGDDGLTQRLGDAIRSEFIRSALFTLEPVTGRSALRVIVPNHVGWEKIGRKTRVAFRLNLQRDGRNLGKSGGQCWEKDLSVCAQQAVAAAKRVLEA